MIAHPKSLTAGLAPLAVCRRHRRAQVLAFCALAALAIALLLSTPIARADDLSRYRTLMVELLAQAQIAEQEKPPLQSLSDHARTSLALEQLERVKVVEIAGHGVPVEIADIAAGLRGTREEGIKAIVTLRLALDALDSPSRAGVDSARQALDEVYKSSALSPDRNPVADFLQDLRQRLFRWLDNLLARLKLPFLPEAPPQGGGDAVFWAITVTVALFALASFAFAYLRLRNNMARYARATDEHSAAPADAASARLAADRAATMGDLRQAVQYLYRAALLHLTERAVLTGDRSLTNHEMLRALASRPDLAALLGQTVDTFERTWYGHFDCTEADFQRFRNDVDRVMEAG